ncbi:transcriptional repressor LexA [Coralloluteibacterium stylophorae]|uniref:LexA repressor n=1 Tax=Coralloluteibacterium stylophorae TaxID=1776034 RepID=A0A8J7VRX4_9GAMM|nr:transcriptional repressor LexA [Coralloluteibacterium stylophorae]MBS7455857.1 transcriptional repressor LexA [Coralloluteibacterium stylophorae]
MDTPTDRQQAILDHLAACLAADGRPPTLAELARAFGILPNAARKHLQALEAKGWIELAAGKARGIRLLGGRAPSPSSSGASAARAPRLRALPGGLSLPLVGRVAAGSPILSEGNIEAHFGLDPALFRPRPHFLLRVEGQSMTGAGILDGDLIAVHRTPVADSGRIVVARVEGEITVKRLDASPARIRLLSENPAFAPIEIGRDVSDFAIEGLYVGAIRRT